MMLRTVAKFVRVLNSEAEPGQISLAFALSMIAGLTPLLSLHNLLVLFLVLILRVNLSSFLIGLAFFSAVAYLLDPLFHQIGLVVLTAAPLQGLWTTLYNSTPWRIEHFNNSIVMGSLLFSIAFFVPLYLVTNYAILRYREVVLAWARKTRFVQMVKASRLYQTYRSLSAWGGET